MGLEGSLERLSNMSIILFEQVKSVGRVIAFRYGQDGGDEGGDSLKDEGFGVGAFNAESMPQCYWNTPYRDPTNYKRYTRNK